MSRLTQGINQSISFTCTGLSPPSAGLSIPFHFEYYSLSRPYNPTPAKTDAVWACSFSLATTQEITVVFFSSEY